MAAGLLGAPVDIAAMLTNPLLRMIGQNPGMPVGGTESIGSLLGADVQSLPFTVGSMLPFSPGDLAMGAVPLIGRAAKPMRTVPDMRRQIQKLIDVDLANAQRERNLPEMDRIGRMIDDIELDIAAKTRPVNKELKKPSDDALFARYDSPEDVPKEVRQWVSKQSIITQDATDAVRWERIRDTANQPRMEEGPVTVFRAIGDDPGFLDEIRPGDWVTTNESYAISHLLKSLGGKGRILKETVSGKDVLLSPTGNFEEAIFAPMKFSSR